MLFSLNIKIIVYGTFLSVINEKYITANEEISHIFFVTKIYVVLVI